MKNLKNFLALSVFSLLILAVPSVASAQWGGNDRNRRDDDYYGRDRRDRNDDYNRRNRNDSQAARSVLRRLKENTRDFVNNLDRELDNSRYDGRRREDNINRAARDFRTAVNRLNATNSRNGNNNDYNEIQEAMNYANRLQNALRRSRLNSNMQNQWSYIRQDLNTLANYYGNGRYNNRTNNNGDWRSRIPFPLPF